jgi:hypothetical protein
MEISKHEENTAPVNAGEVPTAARRSAPLFYELLCYGRIYSWAFQDSTAVGAEVGVTEF